MRRVMVIGSGGAGKSTLAKQLGNRFGLPVIHLDQHYWNPGWVETPEEEWEARVAELAAGDRWVIDGNYSGTMALRLARADTVIFLDFPRVVCLYRAVRRVARHRGRTRPDMPPGCPEHFDWIFLKWIWDYPKRTKPTVLRLLNAAEPGVRVFRLRTPSEAETLCERLAAQTALEPDQPR